MRPAAHRRHEAIKGALWLRQTSLSDIARELRVQASTVTSVSQGRSQSTRVQEALAYAIGMEPEVLWPERAYSAQSRRREE